MPSRSCATSSWSAPASGVAEPIAGFPPGQPSRTPASLTARQSGTRTQAGKKGQGNGYLRGYLGQAAIGAAGTATFPGERYSPIARRRGKANAQVAVARSLLVVIWHLLADPATRYTDLGHGYYQARLDTDRKLRNHIRQIQALGFDITITKAA